MDPTTVIAVLALNLLCASGLFVVIGRQLPPRQGLGLFALGCGLFGLAYVLRLVLGLTSSSALALLPDAMMVGAALLFIGGLRQMVGRDAGPWWWLAVALCGFVAIHLMTTTVSGAWGRHVWLNLALGAAYSVLAGEALHEARHGPRGLRQPLLLMAALMAGLASLTLARSLWTGIAGTGTLYDGWPAQLYYGYASVAALLLVPCMQWMVFSRLNQQLAETARRDPLTGLLNRSGLDEAVARHWGTRPVRPLTLMHLDVDYFKSVNDGHGHAFGDQVLQALAKGLATGMRGGDFIARVGGEEFLAICVDLHPLAARAMAERLREIAAQVAVPVPSTHSNLSCTVSVGVSRPCDEPTGYTIAWREADQALYAAKNAGRDRVRMFTTLTEVQVELPPQRQAALSAPVPLEKYEPAEQDTTPDGLAANLDDGPAAQRAAD